MFKKILSFFNRSRPKVSAESVEGGFNNALSAYITTPVHKVLTLEILDNTDPDQLLQVVLNNLFEKLPANHHDEVSVVLQWNKSRQAIYIIWWLDAEVNNGGFNQYYANPSGEFFQLLPDALELIGAVEMADLVHTANQLYEDEFDKVTKDQDGTVEGFIASYEDNPLDAMDNAFFEIYKTEYLLELLEKYIRKHKKDFIDA